MIAFAAATFGLAGTAHAQIQREADISYASRPEADLASFSETVFFGDSQTDSGFFRPLLPASVRPVTGQFTTNSGHVWSQALAAYYGTYASPNGNGQIGTNYAAGGARVGSDSTGALGPIPSLRTQLGNYLNRNGNRADPGALYAVWGGMNDIFMVTNGLAPATPTLSTAASDLTGIVSSLTNAGARYIMVATTPDLGLAPSFVSRGSIDAAQASTLSTDYNQLAFASLATANLRVIPLDMLNISRELHAEAAAFGFSNITGTACQPQITANSLTCNFTSVVTQDARNTYLYADGIHYTLRAHDIIAQYAKSMIEGPRQIAQLPYTATMSGRARAERVFAYTNFAGEADRSWWFDLRGERQRRERKGSAAAVLAGFDLTTRGVRLGLFGGYSQGSYDFPGGGGYEQSELTAGGYAAWQSGGAWVQGQVSYTAMDFDIDREVRLAGRISNQTVLTAGARVDISDQTLGGVTRHHRGSPDGSALGFALNAGWEFKTGQVRHGPVAGILAQRIRIAGYSESDPELATALAYPKQSHDSLLGSLGWQISTEVADGVEPYARAQYQHEFGDYGEEAFARALTIPNAQTYAVPGIGFKRGFAAATIGLRAHPAGIRLDVGTSMVFGQGSGGDATAFLGLSRAF